MHIWTAIDLNSQLADLRRQAKAVSDALDAPNHALTLPLHVSLRISFPVDDAKAPSCMTMIEDILRSTAAFPMAAQRIELQGDAVVWLSIAPSDALTRLHETLVRRMQEAFDVPPHPFDLDFRYHASLFIGENASAAFGPLKDAHIPPLLTADRFVIGTSATGKPGTYRVVREIPARRS